jgi:hypothetical protein
VKTALVICSDTVDRPREPFEQLYRDRTPSRSTGVWLGAWALGPYKHCRTRVPVNVPDTETPAGATNAYSVSFSVGFAAFHVFAHWGARQSRYDIALAVTSPHLEPPARVEWPPLPPLTEADLDAVGNAHGKRVLG